MRKFSGYLSIAALLIVVVVDANTPVPGIAAYGENINAPASWAQADPDRIVVATYNIRRSKGGVHSGRNHGCAEGSLRNLDGAEWILR